MEGNVINLEPQRRYQGYDNSGNAVGPTVTASSAADTVDIETISSALDDAAQYLDSELEIIENGINTVITDHSTAVQISGVNYFDSRQSLIDNISNGQKTFESEAENLLKVAASKYNEIQEQKNSEASAQAKSNGGDGGSVKEV